MKKIILTGGGTAGHVTPNLALLPELRQRGYSVEYIGSKTGIERELITQANVPLPCDFFRKTSPLLQLAESH